MTDLQIQYFLKVTESMSFSAAASALFVSQPSVSRQIQTLEKELGYTLIDRTNKNAVTLTPAGMVFRDSFRKFSLDYQKTLAAAREVSQRPALRLRVGIGEGWDFTRELRGFRQRALLNHPQAELHFQSATFLTLRTQVQTGQLDAILCTETCVQNFDGLEITPIAALGSRIYVQRGLLRPAEEPLSIGDFDGQTLLMLPEAEAPMSLQVVQLQLLTHRVQTTVRRLPNRASIYQSLLMGEGFTVFDTHMSFRRDSRLAELPLPDPIPLCVVWNRTNQNPLIRLLAEELHRALSEQTP